MASSALVAFAVLDARGTHVHLQSGVWAPTFITAVIAFAVARQFCAVYEVAIDTIMHCTFVADKLRATGDGEAGASASAHASLGRNPTLRALMALDTANTASTGISAVGKVHIEPPPVQPTSPSAATAAEQAARQALRQFYGKPELGLAPLQVTGKVEAVLREYKGREEEVIARLDAKSG